MSTSEMQRELGVKRMTLRVFLTFFESRLKVAYAVETIDSERCAAGALKIKEGQRVTEALISLSPSQCCNEGRSKAEAMTLR